MHVCAYCGLFHRAFLFGSCAIASGANGHSSYIDELQFLYNKVAGDYYDPRHIFNLSNYSGRCDSYADKPATSVSSSASSYGAVAATGSSGAVAVFCGDPSFNAGFQVACRNQAAARNVVGAGRKLFVVADLARPHREWM